MSAINIRRLLTAREHDRAVELQKLYWGDEAENLVPRHMLHSISHYGGHVLGACDGEELVGLVMGFIGTDIDIEAPDARPAMANLLIMSKRMVVRPEYRGRNIGFRLKMAQRDLALKQAIRLVTWTVDPLLAANAHFNIRKLGAVVQRYAVNYIELVEATGLKSDRLVVEWWVTQRRVKERAKGAGGKLTLQQYFDVGAPIVNRADGSGEWLLPRRMTEAPHTTFALIEIPPDFPALEAADPNLADAWRSHIRDVFPPMLDAGYIVTDFVTGEFEGRPRSFYLLSRYFDEENRNN
ncbi:MAG: GNAT family N-acetyltransferase [Chloroflexota bacterium]|nr:GNAT family N-acetyltransferase [Chloroflexota bacterium]